MPDHDELVERMIELLEQIASWSYVVVECPDTNDAELWYSLAEINGLVESALPAFRGATVDITALPSPYRTPSSILIGTFEFRTNDNE